MPEGLATRPPPKPRGFSPVLVFLVSVVAAIAIAGAFFLLVPPSASGTIFIAAGTEFNYSASLNWAIFFNVTSPGARLVGAWTDFGTAGNVSLIMGNGTVPRPGYHFIHTCPAPPSLPEVNATVNLPVAAGPHSLYWGTGFCWGATRIVVTDSVRLVS